MPLRTTSLISGLVLAVVAAAPAAAQQAAGPVGGHRTDHRDGTSSIAVNRSLPLPWDARVGADVTLLPQDRTDPRYTPPLPDPERRSSGVAWARMSRPGAFGAWDKTTLEARLDPQAENGSVSTRFSRSIPVGEDLSVVLEDGYALIQPWHADPDVPHGVHPGFETDKALRLKLAPLETTLSVGTRLSAADGQWLNSVSAEKKLFGPLSVTGRLSETSGGEIDRSISAGLRKTW